MEKYFKRYGLTEQDIKETTPEWCIEHYEKLLKHTKKSVLRNKYKAELKWWSEELVKDKSR